MTACTNWAADAGATVYGAEYLLTTTKNTNTGTRPLQPTTNKQT